MALAFLAAAVMVLSALGVALASGAPAGVVVAVPHTSAAPAAPATFVSEPEVGASAPHLSTAITNAPKLIYTYKNQQEQDPQDSQVRLYVNATGNAVASYANVQVVFVVETTLYDGVYDPTQGDYGVNNPCTGPCEESDAVPFFVENAGTIAQDISDNNPYSTVTFSMVDYFATINDHDDGDGAEYHVDVGNFVPASQFQGDVVSGFQDPVLSGNWYYSDSDFSDSFLDSSEITALYGALKGSGLAWNPSDHHVIVLIGSTAPRDPHYLVNYAGSHSDWNSGWSSSCEPSYSYGGGVSSPKCEEWNGTGTNNITALANSLNVNINYIDVYNGITDDTSQDYVSTTYADATVKTILSAGCDMAIATGGSWNGPPGYYCSAAETGTGLGNLTCTMGTSCFQGQSGNYNNPPRSWSDDPALGWAITHISFGPAATSNVTGTSNGAPMFQFVPATNISVDPSNPGWTVTCLRHGTPLSGCQQTPTVTSSGSASVYGWDWPASSMVLNDTWEATFNVVATGGPYNVSRPLDACTDAGCSGTVGAAPGVLSEVDYKNFQNVATVASFPASDVYVVYPGMSVSVTPAFSRGPVGLTQSFAVAVSGGQPPYTYQWDLNGNPVTGATSNSFTYTFPTAGTFIVRCVVHDSYNPVGVSGTAQVTIVPSQGSYFLLEGNITDASSGNPVGGAVVALNGTLGSTYSGSNGYYSLGPIVNGTYTLYVNGTGYRPYTASVVVSGNTWVNVAVQAAPTVTYSVRGFLTSYTTAAPIASAAVGITFSGVSYGSTSTNSVGYFLLSGLLNATYALSASASGYAPATVSVTVAGATVWQNFSLTPLPPQTYYITGSVLSSTNRAPISGATVILDYNTTTTGSGGIFLYTNLVNGSYSLNITAPGFYGFTHLYTINGAGLSLTIVLTELPPPPPVSYQIGGTILNVNTLHPIANATVKLSGTTSGGSTVSTTVSAGVSGDYAVTGLANGSYTIAAIATGYENATGHLTIDGASTELNLYLAPTGVGTLDYYTAQGVVLDAISNEPVANALVNLTPNVGQQQTGSDGAFLFRVLSDTYNIQVSKAGYHTYTSSVTVSGANVALQVLLVPTSVVLYPISGLVYDQETNQGIVGATVQVLNTTVPPVAPTTTSSTGGFVLTAANGHFEIEASAVGFTTAFDNVTVQGNALSGVVLYLSPVSAATKSTVPPAGSGIFSPGPLGIYLQLWVPAVIGACAFLFAFTHLRRRHAKLPPPPAGTPTDPMATAPPPAEGTSPPAPPAF